MSSPTGLDASAKDSDVHVIDIDTDVDQAVAPIDKSDIPVINIDKPKQINTLNGNGTTNFKSKPSDIVDAVQKARNTYTQGITRPIKWRLQQLKNLLRLVEENHDEMLEALRKDLRRSKMEASLMEIDFLINDLKHTIKHLKDWAKPEKVKRGFANAMDDAVIYSDPYGVTLVIGAWNFPLHLLFLPLLGAISGGNTVIVKPSEIAEATAAFVAASIPKYLDNDAIIVVQGGPEETTELLKQKFDYIFFTGGTTVGKIVYEAAVKHLTPVTLELGGKSPVYLDSTADLMTSAKRIIWGKFLNAGQVCIAPDYILCTKEVQEKFVAAARKVMKEFYGADPKKSPDLSRIINLRQFNRLQALVDGHRDKIVIGGSYDASEKYIEPTVLANVKGTDKIMQDEIFGPLLPIVPIRDVNDAIQFINEREKPLVLYVFSKSKKTLSKIVDNTSAGNMCVNDVMMHAAVESLPFGGVGASGIGAYHGKKTFDTFTHKKGALIKNFSPIVEKIASARYPPYTDRNLKFLTRLTSFSVAYRPSFKFVPYVVAFALGAGLTYGLIAWQKTWSEE